MVMTDNKPNSPRHLLKGRYLVRSEKCPGQMSVVYLVHPGGGGEGGGKQVMRTPGCHDLI